MGEPEHGNGPVDRFPGEREIQGWISLARQAKQGEQRDRSCERLDRDVQAGLQAERSRQGARRSERGDVADTTLSTRDKRNAVDARPGGSAVEGW